LEAVVRNPGGISIHSFKHAIHGDGIVIKGRIALCIAKTQTPSFGIFDVSSSVASFYNPCMFLINPNNFNTNLEVIGECFQFFRFRNGSTALEYVPAVGTSSSGSIQMAYLSDPGTAYGLFKPDTTPAVITDCGECPGSVSFPVWKPMRVPLFTKGGERDYRVWYPSGTGGVISDADWRQIFQGAFITCVDVDTSPPDLTIGKWYFDYEVEYYGYAPQTSGAAYRQSPRKAEFLEQVMSHDMSRPDEACASAAPVTFARALARSRREVTLADDGSIAVSAAPVPTRGTTGSRSTSLKS